MAEDRQADNLSRSQHTLVQQGGQTMREQEPTIEALEEIRAHLAGAHGRTDFDLRRDVAFPESTPEEARVAYLPETRFARARFICSECDGGIFIQGQSTGGRPERRATILHVYPQLGMIWRDGVRDATGLALLVKEWNRGRLGEV
jgi:hypothetical protein